MVDPKQFHARFPWLALAIIISVAQRDTCVAQAVGSIDLTQAAPNRELRRPAAHDGETVQRLSGTREDYDCDPSNNNIGKLRTTLVWLEKEEYEVGDHPKFEVRIENIGDTPATIPFSPHLSDLQPADAGQKFAYLELNLTLWIVGPRWSANTGGGVALYGAERDPNTLRRLHPGEWVQVIGQGHLRLPEKVTLAQSDEVREVNAKLTLYRDEMQLTASAAATVAKEVCIDQTHGPSVSIKLDHPSK
jgi:hypothetical protein